MKKILFFSILILIVLIAFYFYLITEASSVITQDESIRKLVEQYSKSVEKYLPQIQQLAKTKTTISAYELTERVNNITNKDPQVRSLQNELYQKIESVIPFIHLISPLYSILFMISPIPVSILIKLLLEHGRKQFRLIYAKGCFKIISKETPDEIDKARYLLMGLIWYNKFLKKNINLQIRPRG